MNHGHEESLGCPRARGSLQLLVHVLNEIGRVDAGPDFLGVLGSEGFQCYNSTIFGVCSMTSFGISAQTEQTELCWEFIKMMLLQEYQEQVIAYGAFPMRNSVFESQLSASMLPPEEEDALVGSDSLLGPLSEEETDRLRRMVEGLSILRFRYADVTNIIEEEAEGYFQGEKTAEDTAKVIQSRVEIYLSEHS